jgi:hypothetical protein
MRVGISIGILIGIVTGSVFILLLRNAINLKKNQFKNLITIISGILTLPSFWFSGSWLSANLFNILELAEFYNYYILSLTITFILIASYELLRLIIFSAKRIIK